MRITRILLALAIAVILVGPTDTGAADPPETAASVTITATPSFGRARRVIVTVPPVNPYHQRGWPRWALPSGGK